jgi:hypothetical protein
VFSLLSGLVLAAAARALIRAHTGTMLECSALRVALVYTGLVLCPAALYFYLAHPDWSWMYLVDPHRVPRVVVALLVLGYTASLVGGFAAGYALTRAGKFRELHGVIVTVGTVALVMVVLARQRVFNYGTYDDWQGHSGLQWVGHVKLGYALVVVAIASASALAYAGYQLHLAGRRIS